MTSPNLAALSKLAQMTGKQTTSADLAAAQQQAVSNGAITNAALNAPPVQEPSAPVTTAAPNETPKPLTKEQRETTTRAFQGPFHGFKSLLTAKGLPFTFYNGYLVTQDPEVIAECANIPGVEEISVDDPNIQYPPNRRHGGNRSATAPHPNGPGFSATTITPLELMTRSIGNSTHVPQASESFSQTSN